MKRILSWNVNGIRALERKGALEPILAKQYDILLFQETKADPTQLSSVRELCEQYGYTNQSFSSSQLRKGHSGVMTVSRETPSEVTHGLISDNHDEQGRLITSFFDNVTICNVYVPNGGSATSPLDYKLAYLENLAFHVKQAYQRGNPVLLCGDINVAHTEIDLARPKENKTSIGFLPEERAILDNWVSRETLIDLFRWFHPNAEGMYTYWDQKSRARDRNVGWRIDYAFTIQNDISDIVSCSHLNDITGSDHCPIDVVMSI